MSTRLLSVRETAAVLKEHPDTTRARLRSGELTGVKKRKPTPGKLDRVRWYVTESALDHFIRKNTQ